MLFIWQLGGEMIIEGIIGGVIILLVWITFRPDPYYSRMANMYGDPEWNKEVRRKQVSTNEVFVYNKYGAIISHLVTVPDPFEDQIDCNGKCVSDVK